MDVVVVVRGVIVVVVVVVVIVAVGTIAGGFELFRREVKPIAKT